MSVVNRRGVARAAGSLVCVASLAFLFACDSDPYAPEASPAMEPGPASAARGKPAATITGSVSADALGGLPGITVTASPGGYSAVTDDRGAYEIAGVEKTEYTLTLSGLPAACADPGAVNVAFGGSPFARASFDVLCDAPAGVLANAGADQDVARGATVTLDGSNSIASGKNVSYAWSQILGPLVSADGTLNGAAPVFDAPAGVTALAFELTVTGPRGTSAPDVVWVWVLEDPANAYWIAEHGDDAADGTRAAPMRTIQGAIDRASAEALGADVYVAGGSYDGSITLRSGVSVYGGFGGDWRRDPATFVTGVNGGSTAINGQSVLDLTVEGLGILAADASEGMSSYGILLSGASGVRIVGNRITAGSGGAGAAGAGGADGRNGGRGRNGAQGSDDGRGDCWEIRSWEWDINRRYVGPCGGAGGYAYPVSYPVPYNAGGQGGRGGYEGLDNAWWGWRGYGGTGGGGGAPGERRSKGSHVQHGHNGGVGGAGANGSNGAPAPFEFGEAGLLAGAGPSGLPGRNGSGGGGGGGGGAQGGDWVDDGAGNGGGGGGQGGEGGSPGTGGVSGGGSFGVFLFASSDVTVRDNVVTTAAGGDGGAGGAGGAGGSGGAGGAGGNKDTDEVGRGGNGGRGGHGGAGGHGAGGNGGPSVGVLEDATTTATVSGNTIAVGTAGAGGASAGVAGLDGFAAEHWRQPASAAAADG